MSEDKHPGGRPSKYKDEMCQIALDLMKEGASKTEVCAALDIHFSTLLEWCDPDSNYFKAQFSLV